MENKKSTTVEWLFAHLLPFLPFSDVKEREHFRKCLEEAKAMEKQKLVKAWDDGNYAYFYSKETSRDFDNGEQYYNETYKGGKQ